MARLRSNTMIGSISDASLTAAVQTINSAAFATLPVVAAPDIMALTLDPLRVGGAPEIVWVTGHASGSTAVTVLRGQEGSVARIHGQGEQWVHAATTGDYWGGGQTWFGAQTIDGMAAFSGAPATVGTPITGYLQTNSKQAASQTALNPGLVVFGGDAVNAVYGMDLGYSAAFGLRFLSGGSTNKFFWGYHATANPADQSAFTEIMRLSLAEGLVVNKGSMLGSNNWPGSTWAVFGYQGLVANSYALLQGNTGDTFLNAASGHTINFRINNGTSFFQLDSTGALVFSLSPSAGGGAPRFMSGATVPGATFQTSPYSGVLRFGDGSGWYFSLGNGGGGNFNEKFRFDDRGDFLFTDLTRTNALHFYPTFRRIQGHSAGAMEYFNSVGANSNPYHNFWRSDSSPVWPTVRIDLSASNDQSLTGPGTFVLEANGPIAAHARGTAAGVGTSRGSVSFVDNDAHSWESDGAGGWIFRNGWNSAAAIFKFYGDVGGVLLAQFTKGTSFIYPPTWHNVGGTGEPAFENSWAAYPGWPIPRFCKDAEGFVHLEGLIYNGAGSTAMFHLPVGYRPVGNHMFNVIAANGGFARIDVYPDGSVLLSGFYDAANNGFVQLDGIKFSVN